VAARPAFGIERPNRGRVVPGRRAGGSEGAYRRGAAAGGLREPVTRSPMESEALARNPERLAAIRAKLVRDLDTEPLFDTAGTTRGRETACTTMWLHSQDGLPPASFAVDRVPRVAA
jgi:hypothetical protein